MELYVFLLLNYHLPFVFPQFQEKCCLVIIGSLISYIFDGYLILVLTNIAMQYLYEVF